MTAQQLGDRVRALRKEQGLTIAQLAERSGVQRTTMGDLELGRRDPTLLTVLRVARGLGVDAGDLVRGLGRQ